MADFQQNYLSSLAGGLQIGQQIKQQRDTSQINRLAGQAYGAAPQQQEQLLGQMNAINPQMAQEQEKGMAYSDERRNRTMVNMARTLMGAPEQARAGIYDQMVPTLSRFGMSGLPQRYDPETSPVIMQAAKSLIDASMGATGTPTDVRSFQMMTAGMSPEDQMKARRINLGLDGRASSSGFSQVKFTGADGRERIGVLNGKTGQIDLPDGTSFNPQTGAISQTQGEQAAAPQSGGQHFGAFASLAGEFPGVVMTSGVRTAERNQQVGGAANSQHLTGSAADYSVPPQLKPAFIARAKQLGYQAIDEGDHIHLQLARGAGAGGSGAFVGRSPEEQAALTEQAKTDVQLRNLPTELNLRTDAALREAGGKAAVEAGAKRQSAQAENDRSFSLYDTAMKGVSEGLGNAMTGPIAGRLPAVTAGQQIAEGGVSAIAPILKQLFRSAGEGSFTDRDQDLLMSMIPTRTDLPEARQWKIENIDKIVREKLGQPRNGAAAQPRGASPVPASDFSNLWN